VKRPEEQRSSQLAGLTLEDIAAKVHKEEEDDIKVFRDDQKEPSSLMDVEYSLVVKYAKYSLQIFRLYVVYDGENKKEVISQLRDKVKNWDKS
jgi:hypothetical protein